MPLHEQIQDLHHWRGKRFASTLLVCMIGLSALWLACHTIGFAIGWTIGWFI